MKITFFVLEFSILFTIYRWLNIWNLFFLSFYLKGSTNFNRWEKSLAWKNHGSFLLWQTHDHWWHGLFCFPEGSRTLQSRTFQFQFQPQEIFQPQTSNLDFTSPNFNSGLFNSRQFNNEFFKSGWLQDISIKSRLFNHEHFKLIGVWCWRVHDWGVHSWRVHE